MADVVSGREFEGFMLAVGFESRKAGMMASQVGVGSWLGGPVIFPSELASKCINDQAKMIEGRCTGKREAFVKDGSFRGSHTVLHHHMLAVQTHATKLRHLVSILCQHHPHLLPAAHSMLLSLNGH